MQVQFGINSSLHNNYEKGHGNVEYKSIIHEFA